MAGISFKKNMENMKKSKEYNYGFLYGSIVGILAGIAIGFILFNLILL